MDRAFFKTVPKRKHPEGFTAASCVNGNKLCTQNALSEHFGACSQSCHSDSLGFSRKKTRENASEQ